MTTTPEPDQWKVEYVQRDGTLSKAYVDVPPDTAVDEMMTFDATDKHTDEAIRVRWNGERWEILPEFDLVHLSVSCDHYPGCGRFESGDFRIRPEDDKPTRLGYVLDHVERLGWRVGGRENPLTAKTYCPVHR